jgi:hypothetical protein
MGFTVPLNVTASAVSSYLAVSPLPVRLATPSAVYSLLHFPSPCDAQPLAGIPPCGARTFLPAPKLPPDAQRLPGRLSVNDYTHARQANDLCDRRQSLTVMSPRRFWTTRLASARPAPISRMCLSARLKLFIANARTRAEGQLCPNRGQAAGNTPPAWTGIQVPLSGSAVWSTTRRNTKLECTPVTPAIRVMRLSSRS